MALSGLDFSEDGTYLAYATSASGSDWMEWKVREVATGKDLADVIKWSKFSGAAWKKDGSGFYYSRYDAPKSEGEAFKAVNKYQKVYFHRVGTAQDKDELVYERPDQPDWGLGAEVTDDGRWLLIVQSEGTNRENRVFLKRPHRPEGEDRALPRQVRCVLQRGGQRRSHVLRGDGQGRARGIGWWRSRKGRPEPPAWKTLIPQATNRDVLSSVSMIANRFVAVWRVGRPRETEALRRWTGSSRARSRFPPSDPSPASPGSARTKTRFYAFTSFNYPSTTFRYDFATRTSAIFKQPTVDFDPSAFETKQVFYPSKDGTKIPMFIVHRKGLVLNGSNPTYLYGYGGFDVSLEPAFSPSNIVWMEMGGVYAQPNLRGGGEYGKEWHDAGRLKNKQNVFDDFIAAAEWLIANKYTIDLRSSRSAEAATAACWWARS